MQTLLSTYPAETPKTIVNNKRNCPVISGAIPQRDTTHNWSFDKPSDANSKAQTHKYYTTERYFNTPNFIVDNLLPLLTPYEFCVLTFIIRKTYGFHKIKDRISYTQFVNGTGLSTSTIKKVLTILEKFHIIGIFSDNKSSRLGFIYGVSSYKSIDINSLKNRDNVKRENSRLATDRIRKNPVLHPSVSCGETLAFRVKNNSVSCYEDTKNTLQNTLLKTKNSEIFSNPAFDDFHLIFDESTDNTDNDFTIDNNDGIIHQMDTGEIQDHFDDDYDEEDDEIDNDNQPSEEIDETSQVNVITKEMYKESMTGYGKIPPYDIIRNSREWERSSDSDREPKKSINDYDVYELFLNGVDETYKNYDFEGIVVNDDFVSDIRDVALLALKPEDKIVAEKYADETEMQLISRNVKGNREVGKFLEVCSALQIGRKLVGFTEEEVLRGREFNSNYAVCPETEQLMSIFRTSKQEVVNKPALMAVDRYVRRTHNDNTFDSSVFPDHIRDYAIKFVTKTGIIPAKKDRGFWIKAFTSMEEKGVTVSDMEYAIEKMRKTSTIITSPKSVEGIASAIVGNRRVGRINVI